MTPCCFQHEVHTWTWQTRPFLICPPTSSASCLCSRAPLPQQSVSLTQQAVPPFTRAAFSTLLYPFGLTKLVMILALSPHFFQKDSTIHPKLSWVPFLCEPIAPYTLLGWIWIYNLQKSIYNLSPSMDYKLKDLMFCSPLYLQHLAEHMTSTVNA